MKAKMYLFILVLMCLTILLPHGQCKAQGKWQVPDSCLKMELPMDIEHGYYNPDSVMIDSCIDSPTFGKRYVKNDLIIGFDEYIFFQKPIPSDITVDYTAIDSINYYNTYIKFKELYNILGEFKIHRREETDSGSLYGKIFYFVVNEYFCYDSLKSFIDNIEHVNLFHFKHIPDSNASIEVNEKNEYKSNIVLIYPQPTINNINIKIIGKFNFITTKIEIYNLIGYKIYETESMINNNYLLINIPVLNNGVYFIKIKDKIYKFLITQ